MGNAAMVSQRCGHEEERTLCSVERQRYFQVGTRTSTSFCCNTSKISCSENATKKKASNLRMHRNTEGAKWLARASALDLSALKRHAGHLDTKHKPS